MAWDLGDYPRMALCGARVTALAPERFEGYLLKGVNERHHGNLEEAETLLRQAADRAGDSSLPHLVLGRVLEQLGDDQAALNAYETALAVEPQSADALALFEALNGQLLIAGEQPDRVGKE